MRKLERFELRNIFGGLRDGNAGSCTATCGHGDRITLVTCSGNPCEATDQKGCIGDDEKSCP